MNSVQPSEDVDFDSEVPVLIVGAGAAGLCAALAASEAGIEPVVIERDAVPAGSTALSAGLIPAAGTRLQRGQGIADSTDLFAADIARKAHGEADAKLVRAVAEGAGKTVEWLADTYALPFEVITDFNYPGHSAHRMHGLPGRTGAELIDRLRSAVEARDIPILTGRVCETLFADEDGFAEGVEIAGGETIGCGALVLCCNGYGGNAELVRRHIPEMGEALYFGHPGNQGDAVLWGEALGARLAALSGYQGHGSVATPHNILVTWAAITEGGFQVNAQGRRFHNEALGYSEAAAQVLRQPGGIAFDIFDARIAGVARQFEDFRNAEKAGALIAAGSIAELAARIAVPVDALVAELTEIDAGRGNPDRFGRVFAPDKRLTAPYCAIKVTGALFHTQGGLAIDPQARVLDAKGRAFPNLFAAGGAAVGVSGSQAAGYLSGNGLLTATVFGRIAGTQAAKF
ncbi:MAG: fumarate reductase flavoprotein subunit [Hyphomicrobiales bacterium]|jgi:fumarate reductase flavoprotein subunit|nr:fumarate reductase flavoprotein subunit [Hyphomicrobiales bacterium]